MAIITNTPEWGEILRDYLLDLFEVPRNKFGLLEELLKPLVAESPTITDLQPVDPNFRDGYRRFPPGEEDGLGNVGDGRWYKTTPTPPYDNSWEDPANPIQQQELDKYRENAIKYNKWLDDYQKSFLENATSKEQISPAVKTWWDAAIDWLPWLDPLTLDLDGDGIETIGINAENNVLFDHDGDGAKHGTGWISADDAMLVLDKNGNGTIDSGRELFGDSTIKSNGQQAVDGFDALKNLDSNNDGVINSSDAQFANLQLWRDLNQDGVSQTGELFALADYNIVSLNVTKTENSQTLSNGNQLADKGTFTQIDPITGEVTTGNMADINLINDRFKREFADTLDTSSVASLPDMQGSGVLRDLREAATQSSLLQTKITEYAAATTRAQQLELLDDLIEAWADTGGMTESLDDRAESALYSFSSVYQVPIRVFYYKFGSIEREVIGDGPSPSMGAADGGTSYDVQFGGRDIENEELTPEFRQEIINWTRKIHILESFNGNYFFGLPGSEQSEGAASGATLNVGGGSSSGGSTSTYVLYVPMDIRMSETQVSALQKSYDTLLGSVYQSLLLQTRFDSLLDQINLVIDDNGIRLDFTELNETFSQKIADNAQAGLIDLIDFNFASKELLSGTGWNGWRLMSDLVEANPSQAVMQALQFNAANLKDFGFYEQDGTVQHDVSIGSMSAENIRGGIGDDTILGLDGNDNLFGGEGVDTLIGGAGNDFLHANNSWADGLGQLTDDVLEGGTGNDYLHGTDGVNTYIFNKGDGADVIYTQGSYGPISEGDAKDKIVFGPDITPADVTFVRLVSISGSDQYDNDLFIKFTHSGDQIIIKNWYLATANRLFSVEFTDGTVLSEIDFKNLVGTDGNDSLRGDTLIVSDETMNGGAGNDKLYGGNGTETLIGGSGDDYLYGNTTYTNGVDELTNDVFEGGTGDDRIYGTGGANTYIYNKGDGADIVATLSSNYAVVAGEAKDKIVFGADITPSDVTFSRLTMVNGSSSYSHALVVNFSNSGDQIIVTDWYYAIAHRVLTIEFADGTVWGEAELNQLVGTDANDTIIGDTLTEANEHMRGGAGNDSITGGTGVDTILGGDGNDILYAHTLSSDSKTILTADDITGGLGNDRIDGTGGANIYRYNLGDGADTIDAAGSNGTLEANLTAVDVLVLGAGITAEDITFTNVQSVDLMMSFANSGDSILFEDWYKNASNRLASIQFADGSQSQFLSIEGTAASDYLVGTTAADSFVGGDGNDTYFVNNTGDVIAENAAEGIDTVYSTVTYTLASHLENLILNGTSGIHATGNSLNNVLTGNSGANSLTGGLGDDTLVGGLGNDTYAVDQVGDVIIEMFDQGLDKVNSSVSYTLSDYVENLTLTGAAAINATGNNEANLLTGNGAANIINGGLGNDTIDGGLGDDTMTGGDGDDTYTINVLTDVIIENANEGVDTIIVKMATAGSTYTVGDHFENATISNNVAYHLTGNSLDNLLIGNGYANRLIGADGNDTLDGGAGIDTMTGGTGNDTYVLSVVTDVIVEDVDSGNDTVKIAFSTSTTTGTTITLGTGNYTNIENIIVSGTGLQHIVGTDVANNILANTAATSVDGGDGNDTINGAGGNDTLLGGNGLDTFVFSTTLSSTTNVDTVLDFNVADDQIWLDKSIFAMLTAGNLSAANFALGTTASDANDYILYDTATGELFYDRDGTGTVAAVKFAVLSGQPALSQDDFLVI